MKDLHSLIKVVDLVKPIVGNNTSEGTPANGADRRGFGSVEHVAAIGVSGDTLSGSVKIDVILQDSDDDSTYAAVTNADYALVASDGVAAAPNGSGIIATIDDAAEDNAKIRCGYIGPKRYSRLLLQFTGTHTNGTPIHTFAILGHPNQIPTSDV